MANHTSNEIIQKLKLLANPNLLEGMARFGIKSSKAFGVRVPVLRSLAKEIGKNNDLAHALWGSGVHEARILASMVADPKRVTQKQMEDWVNDFDSWDVCDQVCLNLFKRTLYAYEKAVEWSRREKEFVKRAGFALMACLILGDKKASDGQFEPFWHCIGSACNDERNFVKKAVNWALRQLGKRNKEMNERAILFAQQIIQQKSKSAYWIATDALQELKSEAVQRRLRG